MAVLLDCRKRLQGSVIGFLEDGHGGIGKGPAPGVGEPEMASAGDPTVEDQSQAHSKVMISAGDSNAPFP